MSITFNFIGRAAVVTGGAQGIGRAVVEKLLGGGAASRIWDRDKALAERTASELAERGKVVAVGVDVGDYASVERGAGRDRSPRSARSTSSSTAPASPARSPRPGSIARDQWDQVIRGQPRAAPTTAARRWCPA